MENSKEFIGIIQQNEGLIFKIARIYTNTKEDERDLYQEIIYQLWKSFPSFRHESRLSTWMYRVAMNTAITQLNKDKRRVFQVPFNEILLNTSEVADTLADERSEVLFALIKKLSDPEKGIILLYLEGKNYEEIAAITGFTATNVGTRLGRIKQKLMSQIK